MLLTGGSGEILAVDAVFHSPVVPTPQRGKPLVTVYLATPGQVSGGNGFRYVRGLVEGDQAVLEFEAELDGIHVNGVDLIRSDGDGRIVDFKVMLRPVKAVNKGGTMRVQLDYQSKDRGQA